jgi:hypothetical protein
MQKPGYLAELSQAASKLIDLRRCSAYAGVIEQ